MENKRRAPAPNSYALWRLKEARRNLTRQQYRTLRGQIIAGNADGALRGLHKILQRRGET